MKIASDLGRNEIRIGNNPDNRLIYRRKIVNYRLNPVLLTSYGRRSSFIAILIAPFVAIMLLSEVTLAGHALNSSDLNPNPELKSEPIQILRVDPNLNPARVSLGKKLFQEKSLSRGNVLACSSCHLIDINGANNTAFSQDRDGNDMDINTLTVFNSSYNHRLFWDGRAKTLEEQINHVVHDKKEFDTDWDTIVKKLNENAQYQFLFDSTYPDGISADNIRDAIASYERSLVTVNSRFDCYLHGHKGAISEAEENGYQLFKSYGCVACHQGANVGGNLFIKLGVFGDYFADRGHIKEVDFGRYNDTKMERDRYVFRVPSLRLAALTPPYFHDASAKTLDEAIVLMAKYQLGRMIPLIDIKHIVAFLRSLPGNMPGTTVTNDCKSINESIIEP